MPTLKQFYMKYLVFSLFIIAVGLLIKFGVNDVKYPEPAPKYIEIEKIIEVEKIVYVDRDVEKIVYVDREVPMETAELSNEDMDNAVDEIMRLHQEEVEKIGHVDQELSNEDLDNATEEILRLHHELSDFRQKHADLYHQLVLANNLNNALLENSVPDFEEGDEVEDVIQDLRGIISDYTLSKNAIGIGVVHAGDFYFGGQYYRNVTNRLSVGGGLYHNGTDNKYAGMANILLNF